MSDSCQRGREHARAFISKWKDFDRNSLKIVNEEYTKGRQGRIAFRLTAISKYRFVIGLMSSILPDIELTDTDLAELSRITKGTISQLRRDDKSSEATPMGREEKLGPGPRDSGPARKKFSIVLKDMDFRRLMKNAEFHKCFCDELAKSITNDETIRTENLADFADGLKRTFRSDALYRASRSYCDFLRDTESRFSEFIRQKRKTNPNLTPICRKKEKEAREFLTVLGNETRAAIKSIRHGNFAGRLARSVTENDRFRTASQESDLLLLELLPDFSETVSLASDLLKLELMLYFLCPQATGEILKKT